MVAWLGEHRRLIITCELVFLVAFLGLYGIRVWNPDLWHPYRGGEKPMDFAYFNAVVRSSTMPPYDPWFSGGYLNYYYFGQFMNAAIAKFTGVMPSLAITLAAPLFFALAAGGVFSIVYNLASLAKERLVRPERGALRMPSPVLAGVIGTALVLVAGNMDGIVQLFEGTGRVLDDKPFGAFDFWRSSRMMPSDLEGITEFPYFTFLFADPHAHLFAIPVTLLALGLALGFILEARASPAWRSWPQAALLAALGLALGAMLATNSWDVITYAFTGAAAVVIGEWAGRRALTWEFVAGAIVKVAVLAIFAALFFLPK
jgi:YYY domain-containing protein